jgi:hypothetical protein
MTAALAHRATTPRGGDIVLRVPRRALFGLAVVLLVVACGGTRTIQRSPGVLVIVLNPVRPTALDGASLPLEVSVRHQSGELLGNYSLSHVEDPLVLLVTPGRYAITVSAGCRGRVRVPPWGRSPSSGYEARVLVSFYYSGGRCHLR